MTIKDSLNDLQNILKQQNSIYETNQNLHFDWLKSVLFQLDVYDQSSKKEIKVKEIAPTINSEKERYNRNMQQKVLSDCKHQLQTNSKLEARPKHIHKKQNIRQKRNENTNSVQKELYTNQTSPNSSPKALPRPRKRINRIQQKSASTSFIKSPIEMKSKCKSIEESKTKQNNNNKRNHNRKKDEVTSPNSQLVKFIDNDSLLSISSSCSDFCNDEENYDTKDCDNQLRLCQSLPSKNSPLKVSCNFHELTQSVSSFQEKWQEMVEEKKRSSLLPKPPVGTLFNFDDTPESYQMTSSDGNEEDNFSFSDEDDEIHEEDPLEIHGKMIPIWARKEKVEEQIKNQQTIDPDDIFTGMPKHCQISQIFDNNFDCVEMSILAQGHADESDNYDELMAT